MDATQLFSFKEQHCDHCLTKTVKKGTAEEKTFYYHQVLEAKIVLGDDLIISIATGFIENEQENVSRQDCERSSFKRLANSLKKMFPRLPICLMGDSLYACEPVFEICKKNKWEFLIRYKRKPKVKEIHKMKWVNDLVYRGEKVAVMELEIEKEKKKWKDFQWVTSLRITGKTANEFAETGRKRWMIENEGFNIQKNYRYVITHANSLDYNAMKNHYLLTQLADVLVQLYENGIKDIKIIKGTIKKISEGLLSCLKKQSLTKEDLQYNRMQIRKDNS